ncbi:aspartate-semialdehyde dehydrogenase [Exiguobacterium antarcticum]|uniref:Aspartate-semialdehyde dehydrogenase n=1 Tax=Exiguobacterium antarcticum TaxID=132920 RepID=A0ABT6R3S7_9BACL|nr:aspartate-semialdehyde dehydrogenase [Exiguobacterium antarcticum]MDI3234956.1 aspartate-semialdehyde dehydrogenase [Exiguobacterium antarcticum]
MYHVAVIGATGAVGQKMLQVLAELDFPVRQISAYASARSAGKTVQFKGQDIMIQALSEQITDDGIDVALFAAGGTISEQYAPLLANAGTLVVDNSSAFRMQAGIPLVVPEVNPEAIGPKNRLIANPNCSTIQSVVALAPLQQFGLKRVNYTTYQAVSGSGQKGIEDLARGSRGEEPVNYPHPIFDNILPHIDVFLPDGYTKEEQKMIDETRKIFQLPELPVSATCVRVPVTNAHSVAINVTFEQETTVGAIRAALIDAPGVVLVDDVSQNQYPMPLDASGTDDVYVGRIRQDQSFPNTFHIWCVADNIRKGAASNAVQVARQALESSIHS